MSRHSQIRTTYTARGLPRFEIEIFHDQLNKYQLIRSDEQNVLIQKANAKMAEWDDIWKKKSDSELRNQNVEDKKKSAIEKTEEAQNKLTLLNNLLHDAISKGLAFSWENLKNTLDYSVQKPERKQLADPNPPKFDPEPIRDWPKYTIKFDFLDNLSQSRRDKKEKVMDNIIGNDHQQWESNKSTLLKKYEELVAQHNINKENQEKEYLEALGKWEQDRLEYLSKRDAGNADIENQKNIYLRGEPAAIIDYCDLVLSASAYPDFIRTSYELDYNPENKILLVDYSLPSPSTIPTLKEVKYIQSTDKYNESDINDLQLNKLYDQILYQITLRTIYELFKADVINALASVVFNGYVKSMSNSTGQEINPCVLSLQANKNNFTEINLANVEPKACFKQLKGVGSSRLFSMTAIAPIMKMDRSDKRFIASYEVENGLNDAVNLALIDWEDFEHLVRELFEEEYGGPGNEVKVTRASRDGGVDAVAFDADPIKGGKIVIQAKRYTNTVGVSAVRDLWGTVMNEGAMKGILVTTADYGPDAYEFAKNKPLALVSGSNLLFLLEKHGHKAKIDLHEAKIIMAQEKTGQNKTVEQ